MLCDYGCGQKAEYQLRNGKWCCSRSQNSCPVIRKKNSEALGKVKEKISQLRRKIWRDPVFRKNREDALKKAWDNDLERREEASQRMLGENNPTKRLEVREKMSRSLKEAWDNDLERRERIIGENNPNWNPNREEVFAPYTESFYDLNYREQIKKEQDYIDPITNKKLTVRACLHHINYNKQNDNRENLIWLNLGTHAKTNFNKEKWKVLLLEINKCIIAKIF